MIFERIENDFWDNDVIVAVYPREWKGCPKDSASGS